MSEVRFWALVAFIVAIGACLVANGLTWFAALLSAMSS